MSVKHTCSETEVGLARLWGGKMREAWVENRDISRGEGNT